MGRATGNADQAAMAHLVTEPTASGALEWFMVRVPFGYTVAGPPVVHVKRDDHALCSERIKVPLRPLKAWKTLEQFADLGSVRPCKRCVRKLT